MVNIVNCTPHDVVLYAPNGVDVIHTFPKSGYVARLKEEQQQEVGKLTLPSGHVVSVLTPAKFGEIEGLPFEKVRKCSYHSDIIIDCPDIIVSMVVAERLQQLHEWTGAVLAPDTGRGAVRLIGQIIGTINLVQYSARNFGIHIPHQLVLE